MQQIQSLVVPTDFSPASQAAVTRAVALARVEGASIHLVHVMHLPILATPYDISLLEALWEDVQRTARDEIEALRKSVEGEGIPRVTAEVASGDIVEAITDATATHHADLLVMGTHGESGARHLLVGSVTARTLRTVDCPVLAVKGELASAAQPITRILLAVDFSAHADSATEVAGALAQRLGAAVDVIHAVDLSWRYDPYTSELGAELEQKIEAAIAVGLERTRTHLAAHGVPVALHAQRGRPATVIAEAAAQLDTQLIVMGTRGNSGLRHMLLGSVAERTLQTAPCSVLAVRAGEPEPAAAAAPAR